MVRRDLQRAAKPHKTIVDGWSIETDGQSPWEAAQVAALDVLMDIAQSFGDELGGGPASSIPRVSPTEAEWTQDVGQALVRGRGERAQSDNAGMSAMMAVLKLCRVRQNTLSSVLDEATRQWKLSTSSGCVPASIVARRMHVGELNEKLMRFVGLQIIVCNSGVKPHARETSFMTS